MYIESSESTNELKLWQMYTSFTSISNVFQGWKLKERRYCMLHQFWGACRYSFTFSNLVSITHKMVYLKAVFGFKHEATCGRNYKLYLCHCLICYSGVLLSFNISEWESHLLMQMAEDRTEPKAEFTHSPALTQLCNLEWKQQTY